MSGYKEKPWIWRCQWQVASRHAASYAIVAYLISLRATLRGRGCLGLGRRRPLRRRRACVGRERTRRPPYERAWMEQWQERPEARPISCGWAWMLGLVRGYPSLNNFFFLIHTRGAAAGSGCGRRRLASGGVWTVADGDAAGGWRGWGVGRVRSWRTHPRREARRAKRWVVV